MKWSFTIALNHVIVWACLILYFIGYKYNYVESVVLLNGKMHISNCIATFTLKIVSGNINNQIPLMS